MKRIFLFLLPVLTVLACSPVRKSDKESIMVSILPQKYFVERIAGDRFDVHVITPPGASPETYEPLPHQMKKLTESVLYFTNGYLMFEDHLADKMGRSIASKIVDLSAGIDLIAGDIVDHGDHVHLHGIDPHYWLSPGEVRIQAQTIYDALAAYNPDHEADFKENFENFLLDIDALDKTIKEALAESKTRTFLIYHPALAYFARQFALNQVALEMDGKEPTAAHLKLIIDLARQEGITAIIVQSQFNMAAAEAVAAAIGGRVILLDPLPENWLENMYEIAQTLKKVLNP